jgi:hypothetical protein
MCELQVGQRLKVQQHKVVHRNASGEYTTTKEVEMFVAEVGDGPALLALTTEEQDRLDDGDQYEFDLISVDTENPTYHRYVKEVEVIGDA